MSFQVTYQFRSQTVQCPPGSSVNTIIEGARTKFKIGKDVSLVITHKDKPLDGALPLRFANLPNNSKLTLKVGQSAASTREVTFRVSIQSAEGLRSLIGSIGSDRSVLDFISSLEAKNSIKLMGNGEVGIARLQILDTVVSESEFSSTSVDKIVGGSSRVSATLSYHRQVDDQKRMAEQERILRLQVQQQVLRDQAKREAAHAAAEAEAVAAAQSPAVAVQPEDAERQIQAETSQSLDKPEKIQNLEAELLVAPSSSIKNTHSATEEAVKPIPVIKQVDTVFLPSTDSKATAAMYEHSEDTYDLTMAQAEIYHKLITNSIRGTKKLSKQATKVPKNYQIRIKFPDRATLQIQLDSEANPGVKLGALLKKIDAMVLPEFRNQYVLKFGYPPFNSIPFSFKNNDTFLHELKVTKSANDIFTEKTTLIWELGPLQLHMGPFIDPSVMELKVTTNNERPEIQLESHRGELPDESNNKKKVESNKGIPKWLRLTK